MIYPHSAAVNVNWNEMAFLMVLISSLFFFIFAYIHTSALTPLQNAEINFSPRIMELFRKDPLVRIASICLELLPLIAFFLAMLMNLFDTFDKVKIIAVWIFLLGVTIDLTRNLLRRIRNFLNPYSAVAIMTHAAKSSIQNDRETDLCDWIDAISEVSGKAITRSSTSLANEGVNELQLIAKNFLASEKSISHQIQNNQTKQLGISDKISFTLFYLFQRLELINSKAVENKLEPVCSNLISALGKITVYAAKFDISLATYPVVYLGKFAIQAQKNNLPEVGVKATLTLLEVARTLANEIDPTYLVIKDAYFSIITQMHEIAKEAFRQDKSTRIDLLTQPFRDLKELFSSEKLVNHPDTSLIISQIDNVLAEFDALEMVLKAIPPIPQIPEDQIPPGTTEMKAEGGK